jgi:hypothetical protein
LLTLAETALYKQPISAEITRYKPEHRQATFIPSATSEQQHPAIQE